MTESDATRRFALGWRVRIVFALVVFYAGWQAWLSFAAPAKIAPALTGVVQGQTQADPQGVSSKVNVLVTLPFAPERFHILAFQRYGRVSGTRDTQIEIRGVARENLRALARPYWVTKLEPLGDDPS